MKRRELLAKSAGALAAVLTPKRILPFTAAGPATSRENEFRSLWREAHLADYFDEEHRAFDLFKEAFHVAAGLDSEARADALEMVLNTHETLARYAEHLASDRRAVETEPSSLEAHLGLADRLWSLGRYAEAEGEYQKVLSHPGVLTLSENATTWPRLGHYHYRKGQYLEAAAWFERTPELLPLRQGNCGSRDKLTPEEVLLRHIESEATLNKLLVSLALNRVEAARASAALYIAKLGRLPWPYRWYLHEAGIDADGIYAETYE